MFRSMLVARQDAHQAALVNLFAKLPRLVRNSFPKLTSLLECAEQFDRGSNSCSMTPVPQGRSGMQHSCCLTACVVWIPTGKIV